MPGNITLSTTVFDNEQAHAGQHTIVCHEAEGQMKTSARFLQKILLLHRGLMLGREDSRMKASFFMPFRRAPRQRRLGARGAARAGCRGRSAGIVRQNGLQAIAPAAGKASGTRADCASGNAHEMPLRESLARRALSAPRRRHDLRAADARVRAYEHLSRKDHEASDPRRIRRCSCVDGGESPLTRPTNRVRSAPHKAARPEAKDRDSCQISMLPPSSLFEMTT